MHRKLPIPFVRSALCLGLALPLAAQTTTNTLTIGEAGATGCQGPGDPPALTGGVLASARFEVGYDEATRRMTLVVSNTSAVVGGDATPLLTEAYLNLPHGAVTTALLVSQTGSGGATPDFEVRLGSNGAGCLGAFALSLATRNGSHGGIANPAATRVGGPPGAAVVGPATFVVEFTGPGAESLNARAITYGWSNNAPRDGVHAAAKFQAGGSSADESGFIGSTNRLDDCATSMWLVGDPLVGSTVTFCRNGQRGCHDCMWVSLFPGPTNVGGITAPIGLPLLAVLSGSVFDQFPLCFPLTIPGDPGLVGLRVYFVLATAQGESSLGIPTYSFGDVFTVRLR
ncbi:MAG: hypothetical protein HZB39_11110 [Planctomycetes bacterium]|nr:hypothetical protein [Planctomycetota bacterium]